MSNEAVPIELYEGGAARNFTVAAGTGVSKGTLMVARDPVSAIASKEGVEYFVGIASADKDSTDGATTLGLFTRGRFDLRVSSTVSAGQLVKVSGANLVETWQQPSATAVGDDPGTIVGKALEDASAAETIAVAVGEYN